MRRALERELVVEAPIDVAWHHVARVADWPRWRVDLTEVRTEPAGELGPQSVATLYSRTGPRTTFHMTAFEPGRHWTWAARVLWFVVLHDHRFERVGERRTRIVVHVDVGGAGERLAAPLVGAAVARRLDQALPRLAAAIGHAGRPA
jgi:hypothetical protein